MADRLFTAFPPVSTEQWIGQVVKDLKGQSFDEKLTYRSADGILVKPFYTREDLEKYSGRKPLFTHSDWEICVEIDGTSEAAGNAKALHALNNGASALLFFVHHNASLGELLSGIEIAFIAVQFVVEGNAASFRENLERYCASKKLSLDELRVVINIDPIENLVRTGSWRNSEEADREEFRTLNAAHNTIAVNAGIYHNAGASPAYEIACTLAHANAYTGWTGRTDIRFQLNVAVGPDYFFGIAKLRALRKTFALLQEEYGISAPLTIHAETASRNLTVFDTHNNLLRTTTAAMAAAIGGCDSLTVKPFDSTCREENGFSDRLARNIQLILKAESYFDKVADVSAGSFFIEELTEQLAAKAWEYFTGIEKQGGFIAAFTSGSIQDHIRQFAEAQQERFNTGQEVLVGTNKFPNPEEDKRDLEPFITWGSWAKKGKAAESLSTRRLSADNEQERLAAH